MDETQKKVKKDELEKFMAVLFLRNASYEKYNKLLVKYRKAYANNDCRYPDMIQKMMDVMRQVQVKKKRTQKPNNKDRNKDGSKDDKFATSLAQKGGDKGGLACFCCGDPEC